MARVSFKLQSKKSPAEIFVRVRRGRPIDLSVKIGRTINVEDWDAQKGMPKHNRNVELKNISIAITKIRNSILENLDEDIANGKNIDADWLREIINPNLKKGIPKTLIENFDFYLFLKKESVSPNTIKKLKSFKKLLIEFEKWSKKKYQINEVDISFQDRLLSFAKDPRYNYHTNYIVDVMKSIKTICENANKHGLQINPQTKLLKAVKIKVPKVYLNTDDIAKIREVALEADYLDNARDWLLISCETGQRVGDFMRFTPDFIFERPTGGGNMARLIEFEQEKTKKNTSVVITSLVEKILQKRNGEFPRKISAQRYNDYIKEVCKMAGINEVINASIKDKDSKRLVTGRFEKYKCVVSHIGRRSFASNYYGKFPTSMLIKQTGHTSERTFLEYIGKSNADLSLDFYDAIYKYENNI